MANKYHEFTILFNRGKKRTVIASGQAVVLHRLAIMSKDGDWIIREDEESFQYVLAALSQLKARYRFGAPLSLDWHRHGWSSHFELVDAGHRYRLDFFSRPPRLSSDDLVHIWAAAEAQDLPFVDKERLIKQKLTDRLKDYAIIGEIVRGVDDPYMVLQYSQSAADLLALLAGRPALASKIAALRPTLTGVDFSNPDAELNIRLALERERHFLMKENLRRIAAYRDASAAWAGHWPELEGRIRGLELQHAHAILAAEADKLLPRQVLPP